jgi:ribosomal protein S17
MAKKQTENKNEKKDKKDRVLVKGVIVKLDSGLNTIKVEVENHRRHPKYEKLMTTHKRYLVDVAEDYKKNLEIGDNVEIYAVRPISARKKWKLFVEKDEK